MSLESLNYFDMIIDIFQKNQKSNFLQRFIFELNIKRLKIIMHRGKKIPRSNQVNLDCV